MRIPRVIETLLLLRKPIITNFSIKEECRFVFVFKKSTVIKCGL